jgi:hypothetical protein
MRKEPIRLCMPLLNLMYFPAEKGIGACTPKIAAL